MGERYEPEYGWAPAWSNGSPRPFIIIHLLKNTRREACEAMGEAWRRKGDTPMQGWRRAYRQGARCVRVRVEATFGYDAIAKASPHV